MEAAGVLKGSISHTYAVGSLHGLIQYVKSNNSLSVESANVSWCNLQQQLWGIVAEVMKKQFQKVKTLPVSFQLHQWHIQAD